MQAQTLSFEHSLARRLLAWAEERFPLGNALGGVIIFACGSVVGRASGHGGALSVGPLDIAAAIAAMSFFLLLRVFDEHKDYADDVKNYPERVLSRGLITLDHLKVVGALCLFLQLGVALAIDRGLGRVTAAWVLTLVYALLMLKEFFCAEWLKQRLVPYALSHMVVSPLAMIWFFVVGAGSAPLDETVIWLVVISYATAATFEVARKTRGPEEERPEVDSYSKRLGMRGAAAAMVAALAVGLAGGVMLLRTVSPASTVMPAVMLLAFVPAFVSIAAFVRKPSASGRKRNEGLTTLALVLAHVAPVIAILSRRGIVWLS